MKANVWQLITYALVTRPDSIAHDITQLLIVVEVAETRTIFVNGVVRLGRLGLETDI